jgi:hypothetical protein
MTHDDQSDVQQSVSPEDGQYIMEKNVSRTKPEEWSDVKDPNERRKIQNKLAQRRFRKSTTKNVHLSAIKGINRSQGTRSKSRRKSRIEKQKTNVEPAVLMRLQNLKILRATKLFRVFHGEVYP